MQRVGGKATCLIDQLVQRSQTQAHQQKAASGLKRGVMDYMNITVNPRWEVNADGLRDFADLIDLGVLPRR